MSMSMCKWKKMVIERVMITYDGFNMCLKCSPDIINSIEHVMFQCQSKERTQKIVLE